MNLLELIQGLTSGQNPNAAIMQAGGIPQQQGAPQQAALPPMPDAAPQGAQTLLTSPASPQTITPATQSPPDLANMYIELMKRNQNAQQLDSGLTLIAAGLSGSPANRAALIDLAGKSGGAGGLSLSASDLVNMQKLQIAQQQQALFNSAKKGLMKQYGFSPAEMATLDQGTVADIIKHQNTQNLGSATDQANGQTILYNVTNGQEIARLGGQKPPDTEVVTDQNTGKQTLINKKTGETIREITGETKEDPTEVVTDQNTGEQKLINKRTGATVQQITGQTKPPNTQIVTNDVTGEKTLNDMTTGKVLAQVVAPRQVGQAISADQDNLDIINKERANNKEPPMTMEYYLKNIKGKQGTVVNVGENGAKLPAPKEGYDYIRNADGTVKIGDDGKPTQYQVSGGPAALATTEKEKIETTGKVKAAFDTSSFGQAAKVINENLDKFGVAGPGSRLYRSVTGFFGGTPADIVDDNLKTMTAQAAFKTLTDMRNASPSHGALGNVTDFEEKMLSSVMGALTTSSRENLRHNMARVQASMELLANDNFNKDPQKFLDALAKRTDELEAAQQPKKAGKVRRIE